jgi:hypothetical protein
MMARVFSVRTALAGGRALALEPSQMTTSVSPI